MRWLSASVTVMALGLLLGGCGANFSSIYRNYQVEKPDGQANSVLIDAKQRAILSAPGAGANSFIKTEDYHRRRDVLVCAEPSPDALSAISSTFAASVGGLFASGDQVQASVAQALQETASELGVRNATIQLLRDGLYRQCEAYMNGLIDTAYYEQIANKYANAMLVLLAVEELSGRGATSVKISGEEGTKSKTDASTQGEDDGEDSSGDGDGDGGGDANDDETDEAGGGGGNTAGEASTGAPVVNVNLPQASSVEPHVSTAVNTMVTVFLTKDTADYCIRSLHLGVPNASQDQDFREAFIQICKDVIRKQLDQQGQLTSAFEISAASASYGPDDCSMSIRRFWKPDGSTIDQANAERLQAAMARQGVTTSITFMLRTEESAEVRRKVGAELGLAECS